MEEIYFITRHVWNRLVSFVPASIRKTGLKGVRKKELTEK